MRAFLIFFILWGSCLDQGLDNRTWKKANEAIFLSDQIFVFPESIDQVDAKLKHLPSKG